MNNSGINLISVLNGTSKVLNIVKETIPLYKKAKPIVINSKEIISVFSKKKEPFIKNNNIESIENTITTNSPTFFQ